VLQYKWTKVIYNHRDYTYDGLKSNKCFFVYIEYVNAIIEILECLNAANDKIYNEVLINFYLIVLKIIKMLRCLEIKIRSMS